MTFRAPGVSPPIVFWSALVKSETPSLFGRADVPVTSVPMKLPSLNDHRLKPEGLRSNWKLAPAGSKPVHPRLKAG
jgi:hypothetical protein